MARRVDRTGRCQVGYEHDGVRAVVGVLGLVRIIGHEFTRAQLADADSEPVLGAGSGGSGSGGSANGKSGNGKSGNGKPAGKSAGSTAGSK